MSSLIVISTILIDVTYILLKRFSSQYVFRSMKCERLHRLVYLGLYGKITGVSGILSLGELKSVFVMPSNSHIPILFGAKYKVIPKHRDNEDEGYTEVFSCDSSKPTNDSRARVYFSDKKSECFSLEQ